MLGVIYYSREIRDDESGFAVRLMLPPQEIAHLFSDFINYHELIPQMHFHTHTSRLKPFIQHSHGMRLDFLLLAGGTEGTIKNLEEEIAVVNYLRVCWRLICSFRSGNGDFSG